MSLARMLSLVVALSVILIAGHAHATRMDRGIKPVLFVVAHKDFYFQEYNDPKQSLAARSIKVVVASQRDTCVPHPNTGQGSSDGVIKSDVLLKDVKADDYSAIVFVGGWGASMYQPAFTGKYDNGEYNSPPEVKTKVNELVTQFTKSDKYVGGICHGVTVLAYCRVEGNSLIKGRKMSGPAIGGPACTVNGKHVNDLEVKSQQHIEQNGGVFVPINSVGDPKSPHDDVTVDGKLITAQDNNSAKRFGEILADLLVKP